MSLFGSLYDEEAGDDAPSPPGTEPTAAPEGEPGPPEAASLDEGVPEVDVPADGPTDDAGTADETPTPTADLDIDAPSMSLEDFAAQMFDGSTGDDAGSSAEAISIEVADDADAGFAGLSTSEPDTDADADAESDTDAPPEPEIEVPELDEPAPAEASDDASGDGPSGFSSLFGDDEAGSPPDESGAESAGPPGDGAADSALKTPQPAGSLASAASDLADLAKSPVATLAPPDADDETETDSDEGPPSTDVDGADAADAADPTGGPIDFGEPLIIDDLLPSAKPSGRSSLSSLSGSIPGKLIAVLLVAALAGFLGMRVLGGNSGGDASAESSGSAEAAPADDPGSEIPRSPGEALDQAQAAGAEVELRNATIAAQAEYANSGTFARSAADWDAVVAQARVADGGSAAPARDVLSVVSDDDAVCFETLLQNGATVAAGVTATAMGFDQDPGGGSICTADAAVIEGWAPSLSGL